MCLSNEYDWFATKLPARMCFIGWVWIAGSMFESKMRWSMHRNMWFSYGWAAMKLANNLFRDLTNPFKCVWISFSECHVINHNPICSCSSGYTGDPFSACYPIREEPKQPQNPCIPTPCGPNADCKIINESPVCSCLPSYFGTPPNCRPECTINPECPANRACIHQKCVDPCEGSCGFDTQCSVINHTPSCRCNDQYTGDPFRGCTPIQGKYNFSSCFL